MDAWLTKVKQLPGNDSTPLAERLAIIHNEFEAIHPFLDGNGRTGRLVLSLLLGRLGCPPAIIHKRDRDAYLTRGGELIRDPAGKEAGTGAVAQAGKAKRGVPPCSFAASRPR